MTFCRDDKPIISSRKDYDPRKINCGQAGFMGDQELQPSWVKAPNKKKQSRHTKEKQGIWRGREGKGRGRREGRGGDYVIALEIRAKHRLFSLALNRYLSMKWLRGKRKEISSQGSMVPQWVLGLFTKAWRLKFHLWSPQKDGGENNSTDLSSDLHMPHTDTAPRCLYPVHTTQIVFVVC